MATDHDPTRGPTATPAFVARGLTKVYRVGEVEVYTLRGGDLDR